MAAERQSWRLFFFEVKDMVRVAIIGASGYTGAESIRILLGHGGAKLAYLTALAEECGAVGDIFPQFKGRCDLEIEPLDMDEIGGVADVALCCLPHKVSMGFVPKLLDAGLKVIDFSADYRLKDAVVYETFYQEHTDKGNLGAAVYGLPELFREDIAGADLVANPGCFPTGALLAIAPLEYERESVCVRDRCASAYAGDGAGCRRGGRVECSDIVSAACGAFRSGDSLDGLLPAQAGGRQRAGEGRCWDELLPCLCGQR